MQEVGRAAVTLRRPSVNRAAHTELGLSKTQNTTKTQSKTKNNTQPVKTDLLGFPNLFL